MKIPFSLLIFMLITSALGFSQRHQIVKKSINVNKNTSIILNIENIYVALEESTDGRIHFDYVIEFDGYSKKDIKTKLDEIDVNVTDSNNHVTLKAKSKSVVVFETFEFKSEYGLKLNGDFFKKKKDTIIRKTKDSLLNEIRLNNRHKRSENKLKYINDRFKLLDKEGKTTNLRKGNVDILRSYFIIKIPPFVRVNINGQDSGVYFKNNCQNELSIKLRKGALKSKSLRNASNYIEIDDANFEAETIIGGTYELNNIKNGKIGTIKSVNIRSEFSKIEIGEIDKNSTIKDFNSEYWFYNWASDFTRFDLFSEYSKIHFFYPDNNHSLKIIGNNTKNLLGNNEFEINMQPTKNGEKYTMMTKESNSKETLSGNIFFDIIHGIIYSHNDSVKKINN